MNCASRPVPGPESAAVISTMRLVSMRALVKEVQLTDNTNNRDDRKSMKHHTVPVSLNHRTREKTANKLANKGQR